MAHGTGRGVEPGLPLHIISQRQHLESPPIQGSQEIINILTPHDLSDGVGLLAGGGPLLYPPTTGTPICPVDRLADSDLPNRGGSQFPVSQFRGKGLHGQAVMRGGPELVEPLVTRTATSGSGNLGLLFHSRGRARFSGFRLVAVPRFTPERDTHNRHHRQPDNNQQSFRHCFYDDKFIFRGAGLRACQDTHNDRRGGLSHISL